jgi:DNA-binding NarL/FixJ family response regulator
MEILTMGVLPDEYLDGTFDIADIADLKLYINGLRVGFQLAMVTMLSKSTSTDKMEKNWEFADGIPNFDWCRHYFTEDSSEADLPMESRQLPRNLPHFYDVISKREKQVLQHLSTGLSNKEIANELYISVGTVKQHLKNIYSKLDVHSRTEAVYYAQMHGILK